MSLLHLDVGTGDTRVRRPPWDVTLVLLFVLLTQSITSLDAGTPLRTLLSMIALLILPGFAVTTFVFPGRRLRPAPLTEERVIPSLDSVERLALSVALSLVTVILIAFIISQTAFGLEFESLVLSVSVVTVFFALLGTIRRLRVPAPLRFAIVPGEQLTAIQTWRQQTEPLDVALTLVLVVAIVGSLSGLGFALIAPQSGEAYTDFQLLTQEGGKLIAGGYPTEMVRDQPSSLVFAVSNFEQETVGYTVVVQIQQVNDDGQVVSTTELDRFEATVAAGEKWVAPHTVTPSVTGEDLRIAYLLYKDAPPANPTQGNSYRQLYLWVTVSDEA